MPYPTIGMFRSDKEFVGRASVGRDSESLRALRESHMTLNDAQYFGFKKHSLFMIGYSWHPTLTGFDIIAEFYEIAEDHIEFAKAAYRDSDFSALPKMTLEEVENDQQ